MPESKNEEERDLSIETYLNHIERIILLLSDVDNYITGKNSRFPKAELSSILREIVDNEMFELMILFMMTYYGIKKQLKNEGQYKDAIDGMRELMGWEKETSKNKINALEMFGLGIDNMAEGKSENALPYLKEASEIDPNNPIILIQLASAYSDIKDFANMNKYFKKSLEMENKFFESKIETTEEFDELIKIFYEKRDLIKKINIKRESYKDLWAKEPEILSSITIILEELIKYFDGEDNRISEKDIPYIMGDIIDDLFEYISIISGVCYFILRHNLGSEKEVSDILGALKYVIGYSEHQDLPFENINILDREHENVYQASRGKMPPPKPFTAPSISQPNTEHAKLLKTIEELVNKPIPRLNLVEYGSTGIRIKNGEIIELALVSEGLSELPEDVCKINSLKKLIIRDDRLSYVPKCIERLSNLESLSICGYMHSNQLSSLPETISNLHSLKSLILEHNRLEKLPETIGEMKNLQELNLWSNNLTSLPESIGHLENLKSLYLSLNRIKDLPLTLQNLKSLEKVSFHQNWVDEFPKKITKLENLKELDLSWNHINSIPNSIGNLKNLRELNLSNVELKKMPESLTQLKHLEVLDLSSNELESLPESIGNMISLKVLNLNYNRNLKSLPDSIGNLRNLEDLSIEECYDVEIPESIRFLKKVEIYGDKDIEIDSEGNFELTLNIEELGVPTVIAYEDEQIRKKLRNPDEIIISDQKIKILFNYPLSVETTFEYEKLKGFSRLDLWRCIYEGYKKIYDEEEQEAGDPGSLSSRIMNRARNNGEYGIWGHNLEELFIERIYYNSESKTISMFIGS